MVTNNAHQGETSSDRLNRLSSDPVEAIGTLLNSIDNHFNNEIRQTISDTTNPQTSLLFLGIHAAILTIGEVFYNLGQPERNYTQVLEQYVDGTTPDTQFSNIATEIHKWRNIVAHQWIGIQGHSIDYDYKMSLGWERRNGILFINPKIYCEHYLAAFQNGGKLWDFENIFTSQELIDIQNRIIVKYQRQ